MGLIANVDFECLDAVVKRLIYNKEITSMNPKLPIEFKHENGKVNQFNWGKSTNKQVI